MIWIDEVRGCSDRDEVERFIRASAKTETNTIGFLPWCAVQRYIEAGTVIVGRVNGDLVAWAVFGVHKKGVRIYQIFTRRDARRYEYGRQLVSFIERCTPREKKISCWCATDLDAMLFWQALEFSVTGHRTGGRARRRLHTEYTLKRTDSGRETLFQRPTNLILPSFEMVAERHRQFVKPSEEFHRQLWSEGASLILGRLNTID